MSNWITITVGNLNDAKVAALVTAARTAALADGQADPSISAIADVVARIRAEISGCATNKLDIDPTKIPKDLGSLAARMIVRQLQSRLLLQLNEDEREEQRNDLRYLERISQCAVPIATPDNPIATEEVQSLSGNPRIESKRHQFARQEGAGL